MWLLLLALLPGTLTGNQTRVLVERYNQVQAAVAEQNHQRTASQLQGLVRDYGSSEFGNELRYALAEVGVQPTVAAPVESHSLLDNVQRIWQTSSVRPARKNCSR